MPDRRDVYVVPMTTTSVRIFSLLLLVAAAACGSSSEAGASAAAEAPVTAKVPAAAEAPTAAAVRAVACDGKTIKALAATLDMANGIRVDFDDAKAMAEVERAKAKLAGKTFAFTGCTFKRQGNEQVTFGAAGTDAEIGCTMKGGEGAVKAFREAAMEKDTATLRLDVRGVVTTQGEDLGLTGCTITVQ